MMEFESTQNLGNRLVTLNDPFSIFVIYSGFDDDLSDEDNQTSVDNYRAVAGEESVDEDVIYIEEEEEATLSVPPLTPYQLPYPVSASRDIVSTIEYSVQEEVHENQDSTTFPRKRKRAEDDSDNENHLVSEDESRETTELDGKAQDQSEDTMLNSRNDDNEQDDAAPAQLVTEEEQAVHSRKRRRTFTLLRSDRPRVRMLKGSKIK